MMPVDPQRATALDKLRGPRHLADSMGQSPRGSQIVERTLLLGPPGMKGRLFFRQVLRNAGNIELL